MKLPKKPMVSREFYRLGNVSVIQQAFCPPEGHRLTHALITSYSIDLDVVAAILLNLTGVGEVELSDIKEDDSASDFDWRKHLLARIEELEGRVAILFESGRVTVRSRSPIERLLPSFLQQVRPKEGGSFHPKFSLLRFERASGTLPIYRMLCSSRNLTRGMMWELLFRTEGSLAPHRTTQGEAVSKFINHLTGLLGGVGEGARFGEIVEMFNREAKRLYWAGVPQWECLSLMPGSKATTPFAGLPTPDRVLVVSPFVSTGWIHGSFLPETAKASRPGARLRPMKAETQPIVICRTDESRKLVPLCKDNRLSVKTFLPFDSENSQSTQDEEVMGDLHAKLYIGEIGSNSYMVVGSANATSSAWGGNNTEFMVRLRHKGTGLIDGFMKCFRDRLDDIDMSTEANESKGEQYKSILNAVRRCELTGIWAKNHLTIRLHRCSIPLLRFHPELAHLPSDILLELSLAASRSDDDSYSHLASFAVVVRSNRLVILDQTRKIPDISEPPSPFLDCAVSIKGPRTVTIGKFQTIMHLDGFNFDDALQRCRSQLKAEDWSTLIWTILGETAAGARIRSGAGKPPRKRKKGSSEDYNRPRLPSLEDWLQALAEDPQIKSKIVKRDGSLVPLGQDPGYADMVSEIIQSIQSQYSSGRVPND